MEANRKAVSEETGMLKTVKGQCVWSTVGNWYQINKAGDGKPDDASRRRPY